MDEVETGRARRNETPGITRYHQLQGKLEGSLKERLVFKSIMHIYTQFAGATFLQPRCHF